MFAKITCPTCNHKFSVPEGEMGKRQTCPNCQSFFVAGKSVAEPAAVAAGKAESGGIDMKFQPAIGGLNKTMVAEDKPMIKYNCPRCKKPLEAAYAEGGTKKPCPECSQRHQVPAAPPMSAAPAAAGLNKTMLASDSSSAPLIKYNCPNCKKPLESPASEAMTKKPCPECGQRLQVPAAPKTGINKTMLATDSSSTPTHADPATQLPMAAMAPAGIQPKHMAYGVAAICAVLLIGLVVPAVMRGGTRGDADAYAKYQLEIEKIKNEVEQRKNVF